MERCRVSHIQQPVGVLAFGPFRLSMSRRLLLRVTDHGEETVPLGSRALEILFQLVRCPGTLVTKNDLIEMVWPGVAVEDNNLTVQMAALRRALGDGQGGSRWIETVPGRGYRFVAAVSGVTEPVVTEPVSDSASDPVEETAPVTATRLSRVVRYAVAGLALAAVTLAGVLVIDRFHRPAALDIRPALSVVVLPFAWVDANADQAYIAEAVTDDLTTRLAKMEGSFVIARATAGILGSQSDSRRQAARLGVRYLLEGSVRPGSPLTRVSARLVNVDTGASIWADQFDAAIIGQAAVQDDIVNRIAAVLGARLIDSEARRVSQERPTEPDALDLILRARSLLNKPQNADRNEQTVKLLRRAVEYDPSSASAIAFLGRGLVTRWTIVRDPGGRDARIAEARSLLEKAEALNPRDFNVVALKALLLRMDGAWEDAAIAYREVLAMRPDWSPAYNQLALCALMLGHPEDAVSLLQRALRIDPMAPDIHARYGLMGQALLSLDRNEEAVEWLRRAVQASPPPYPLYRNFLAAALARVGQRAQAEEELRHALETWPCLTVSMVRHRDTLASEQAGARPFRNALADGLALAGLRDNAGVRGHVSAAPGRCGQSTKEPPGVTRVTTDDLRRMTRGRSADPTTNVSRRCGDPGHGVGEPRGGER